MKGLEYLNLRPNNKISMFRVTSLKILGRVGTTIFFMPPTLKKLKGHIALGMSVHVSVCPLQV